MTQPEDEPCACWLCRDGVPEEIVERALASAAQQGKPMTTLDEVRRWLDTFEAPPGR